MNKRVAMVVAMLGLSATLTGCVNQVRRGNSVVVIDRVPVSRSLNLIGHSVDEELIVAADENHNAIITAGKGSQDIISVYLNHEAINKMDKSLSKIVEWGDIVNKEKIETRKFVGSVSTSSGMGSANVISVEFASGGNGELWLGIMTFCYINPTAPTHKFGTTCDREIATYMNKESVIKLKSLLAKVDDYSNKANRSKSKADALLQ